MSENPAVDLDPTLIFEDMMLSSAFEPQSATIEEKRRVFGKVWSSGWISWLRENFDRAGMNSKEEMFGFGFLVEAFAFSSGRLPRKNTEKGEEAARKILAELHSGKKGSIDLGNRRSNSDFLWVDVTGRRISIEAIGEIKASHAVASKKIGGQLVRQERSLGILAESLNRAKSQRSVKGFFEKRGIVVSEKFDKFIIVPFGEGEKVRQDREFADWKIVELEFSYNELTFIAQSIWPAFRTEIKFGPGMMQDFFRISNKLADDWLRPRLDKVFSDSTEFNKKNRLPYFELGLFFLATGKTPTLESDVHLAAGLVRQTFWQATQRSFNCTELSERGQAVLNRFSGFLSPKRKNLEYFARFTVCLGEEISGLVRDTHRIRQFKKISEVWSI